MKTVVQGLIGLVLAAALLIWVFHDKDPKVLGAALRNASWGGLALGASLNFAHNHFRVLRWRRLLDVVSPDVPYRPMFAAIVLGYLTTWIIPGRIGELVRPALLSTRARIPLGPCMGTVVADRLLDGVAILGLFAAGSAVATFAPGSDALAGRIRVTAFVLLAVVLIALAFLLAASTWSGRIEHGVAKAWGPVRWVANAATGLAEGTAALRSPSGLAWIVAYSLLCWLTIALGTWIGVRAVGADVGFSAVLVMLPMLALGVAIPTPGGAGGYHVAMFAGLTQLFGVEPNVAASVGLLMHLAIVLPVLIAGPILLYTEKVSLRDLVAAAKQVKSLGAVRDVSAAAEAAR